MEIKNCRLIVVIEILIVLTRVISDRNSGEHVCNFGGLLCPTNQICVTYERDCGLGASCMLGVGGLRTYECVAGASTGVPKIRLCEAGEIFVRGYMRACTDVPCPPLWTYKCYPKAFGFTDSCENIKCPDRSECIIEERCRGEFCFPRYTCVHTKKCR